MSSAFGVGDYGTGVWDGTIVTEDLFEELPGGHDAAGLWNVLGWAALENENLALIDDLIARIEALEAAKCRTYICQTESFSPPSVPPHGGPKQHANLALMDPLFDRVAALEALVSTG